MISDQKREIRPGETRQRVGDRRPATRGGRGEEVGATSQGDEVRTTEISSRSRIGRSRCARPRTGALTWISRNRGSEIPGRGGLRRIARAWGRQSGLGEVGEEVLGVAVGEIERVLLRAWGVLAGEDHLDDVVASGDGEVLD